VAGSLEGRPSGFTARKHGPDEHAAEGRTGTFLDYTNNGFARVALDPKPDYKERDPMEDRWLVHLESLEVIEP
jgi:hypothetical protein